MTKPYQRGPNSWQVKIDRAGPDGTQHKINKTFDTRAEAQRHIDITLGKIAAEERVDRTIERATTLRKLLERYRDEETAKREDGHAKRQEESLLRKWMNSEWADFSILSLETPMLAEWRDEQLADGAAPTTVSNPLNTLSKVFRHARTEWGIKVANPVTDLKRPKANDPREAFLRAEQERVLLEACEDGPWQLPWVTKIGLATSMRASEIRRLNWKHIDLVKKFAHLPKTKNGTKRDVPISTLGALELFKELDKLPKRADGYLFGHPEKLAEDGGYTATMLTSSYANAVDRASEKDPLFKLLNADLTFHDLRHISITRLVPFHKDALDLAKTTGHKTLAILMRYYNEEAEDRAARIAKAEEEKVAKAKAAIAALAA
jgi:integrase